MAKIDLKSVFTSDDTYTVLQLINKLVTVVDEAGIATDKEIKDMKASIATLSEASLGKDYAQKLKELIQFIGTKTKIVDDLQVDGDELYLGGTKWLLADRGKEFAIVGTNEAGELGDSLVVTHNDMWDGEVSIFNIFKFATSLPMTVAQDEEPFGMFSFNSDGYTIYFCGQISANKAENRYYLQWGFGYSDTDSELFFCEDLGDGAVNYVENGQLYNDESVILSHLLDSNSADIRYSKATHQHTVLIKFNSSGTDVLAFTAMSSEHFEVKTLQDLKNAFGGGRIACTGGDNAGTRYVYLDTRLANPSSYVVGYIDSTGFHEDESLGSLTGTGGITITDIVSEPN